MTPRSDEEIRADVATMDAAESWSDRYHDAMVRVLHDVEPLLTRATAAEARAERLQDDVDRERQRADSVEKIESRARGLAQKRADEFQARVAAIEARESERVDAAVEWGRSVADEISVLPLFRALGVMAEADGSFRAALAAASPTEEPQ